MGARFEPSLMASVPSPPPGVARFLQKITEAYRHAPGLVKLMLDPYFKRAFGAGQES